jgi:hypothetical protein
MLDWAPNIRLGHGLSLVIAYGVGVLVAGSLLAVVIARLVTHLSRARRDRALTANASATRELHAGPTILTGVVEPTENPEDPPAVRIAITQHGREYRTKNGWHHEWKETSRTVQVRPFSLRLEHGGTVRVAPDESVRLLDALDQTEYLGGAERRRTASLDPGERVTLIGALYWERAAEATAAMSYRSAGSELVLRARRGEPMLLSTQPLKERHDHWARFYAWTCVLGALLFIGIHMFALGPFHRLTFTGRRIQAAALGQTTYTTRNKNTTTTHYRMIAAYTDKRGAPHELSDEISEDAYLWLQAGGRSVPFVVTPDLSIVQAGTKPGLNGAFVAGISMGLVSALTIFFVVRRSRIPWYEQKLVTHRGSGKLVTG